MKTLQNRQKAITVVSAFLLLGSMSVCAEPPHTDRVPRVGFLSPTSPGPRDQAFRRGLQELGYVEGRNIVVEMRFAEGHPERLAGLVQELLQSNVDVLVVGSTIGAKAAKQATSSIPIVFAGSSDPVAGGIVTNLAHPEGNITGFSLAYGGEFAGKWLEQLKQINPGASHFAVLWSSSNKAAIQFVRELESAARTLQVRLDMHHASNDAELDKAFTAIRHSSAQGLIVTPSPFAANNKQKLVEFAAARKLPAIYFVDAFVKVGGLMSYGPDITSTYQRSASHVDKILNGAKPGDLPVEQPTKFELTINLRTSRALGLTVPPALLQRADRIIE